MHDDISPDWIVKRADEYVRAVIDCGSRRFFQIGHQVTRPLRAERIRNRSFKAEHRYRPYWRQNKLRHRFARSRSHREDSLLRRCAAERRNQARDEAVKVLRTYVDVRRVVLRGDSNALGFGWSRRLGERAEVLRVAREPNRQKDCNRSSCEYLFKSIRLDGEWAARQIGMMSAWMASLMRLALTRTRRLGRRLPSLLTQERKIFFGFGVRQLIVKAFVNHGFEYSGVQ